MHFRFYVMHFLYKYRYLRLQQKFRFSNVFPYLSKHRSAALIKQARDLFLVGANYSYGREQFKSEPRVNKNTNNKQNGDNRWLASH